MSKFIAWGNDTLQFDKYVAEWSEFWAILMINVDEILVVNGPRYKQPKEWVHLWTDFWNSLFQVLGAFIGMAYTWSHVVSVGLPIWGIVYLVGLI